MWHKVASSYRQHSYQNYLQCESKKYLLRFSDIFSKRLGIFSPNFTHLLHVPIFARLQTFIQLSATLTKLCHTKRDHPVPIICSMSTIGRNAHVQMFAKVVDSFVDRCLWQVITDLLQCTFYLWNGLCFDGSLWNAWSITHRMVVEWVKWGLVSLVDIGPLHNLSSYEIN